MKTKTPLPSPLRLPSMLIRRRSIHWRWCVHALLAVGLLLVAGCGTGTSGKKHEPFFTSGSREADQRASQSMAKAEQMAGSGEGAGEKGAKKAKTADGASGDGKAAQVETKLALFERLGGEKGLNA